MSKKDEKTRFAPGLTRDKNEQRMKICEVIAEIEMKEGWNKTPLNGKTIVMKVSMRYPDLKWVSLHSEVSKILNTMLELFPNDYRKMEKPFGLWWLKDSTLEWTPEWLHVAVRDRDIERMRERGWDWNP